MVLNTAGSKLAYGLWATVRFVSCWLDAHLISASSRSSIAIGSVLNARGNTCNTDADLIYARDRYRPAQIPNHACQER
jgi:hypothetical protein